jgi:hexosaminidase
MFHWLKKSGRLAWMLLVSFGLSFTACSKKNYSWSTEEEYYQLPIWRDHVRNLKKMKYPQPESTVFIGDSMTEGFDLKRHFADNTLINMGIAGDFTSGVLNRLKYAIRLQPKSIFIMIGINDILKEIDMTRIQNQYANILQTLKTSCPNTFICVQSNLPTAGMGGNDQANRAILAKVNILNTFLKEYCEKNQLYFADMYSQFTNTDGNLAVDYTYDGLHLNDAGYILWKNNIAHLMESK